jgi:hypothetical protein
MITLFFKDGSDQAVAHRVSEKGPKVFDVLKTKMDALMIGLQSHVVTDKLDGQVLQHRTGKLAASIRAIPATVEADKILGTVEGAGGPAWYGRVHEYGGTFDVPKGRLITQIFGNPVKVPFMSKPYTMTFPTRSFMRTSLADQEQQIVEGLKDTTREALSE